ncbi:hypothetical protein NITMOv2_3498 [Nitrospira moscoviensis]|uniref:Uncharacterized protein n=1 Tax=Nitrospira moscoviensis TaxID=42253 RepID=A0A0K2GG04_NITMO|nr:hypothetical protein NITMOv2_3498 [Nitrospira moscoviensis]
MDFREGWNRILGIEVLANDLFLTAATGLLSERAVTHLELEMVSVLL